MLYAARRDDLELLIEARSPWHAALAWIREARKLERWGWPFVVEASKLTAEQRAKCKVVS